MRVEREQTTIRLPVKPKVRVQREAERKGHKQMTLRIQEDLHEELKIISKQSGLTVTSLLILAIWRSVPELKYLLP